MLRHKFTFSSFFFCDYTKNQICNITYTGTCSSIYFINSVIGKLLGHKLGLHNYTKQIWHKNVNTLIFNHNIVENYVSLLGLIEFDHTQTRIITSLKSERVSLFLDKTTFFITLLYFHFLNLPEYIVICCILLSTII